MNSKKKIAFIHRYGLAGWICCGGHELPIAFKLLKENNIEIHFVGFKSADVLPPELAENVVLHELPVTWNRANRNHRWNRLLLWYPMLPFICLYCRLKGMKALFCIDESLPFNGWIMLLFFGRKVGLTVMDFFMRIYMEKHPLMRPLCRFAEWADMQAWKRIPVLYTKVYYTQEFLKQYGIPEERMFIAYNACNHETFYPLAPERKAEIRKQYGFSESDFVLTHHGIMHPNKGNDWMIQRLAELKDEIPNFKFLLIGDGPERGNLIRLAQELGIEERMILPGWLPDETALNEALNAADIGLIMRIGQETDHFHMTATLAHEIACAKPVMAADLRGIAEIITDGENGYLFSTTEPSEFREKLLDLYRNADRRKEFGQKALQTSLRVSNLETCAHQTADPIIQLLHADETN